MVKITDAFSEKILTINYDKTCFIPFSFYANNSPSYSKLTINKNNTNIEILMKNQVRYLGVTIDRHLRWNYHINKVVFTLRGLLFKFRFLQQFLDVRRLKMVYFALVECRLTYGVLSWGAAANNHLKKLENIQKKFLKIMYVKPNTYPSDQLFKDASVLDIRQLFFSNCVIERYTKRHELTYVNHAYQTRYMTQTKATTNFTSKTTIQRSFDFLANRLYNFLPKEIKTAPSKNIFKTKVKRFLKNHSRITIHKLMDPQE